jgi:hypothetical protein
MVPNSLQITCCHPQNAEAQPQNPKRHGSEAATALHHACLALVISPTTTASILEHLNI